MTEFFSRLKVSTRFMLLGAIALALCVIPAAIGPASALLKVVQLTQKHRGLSGLMLGGQTAVEPQRSAIQQALDQAVEATSAIAATEFSEPALQAAWEQNRKDWLALRGKVGARGLSVGESFAAYTSA